MHVLSGRHKGHAARLRGFAGESLTADCAGCGMEGITLRPSQVVLSAAEVTRMRESHASFLRGGRREAAFWQRWELAEGGVLRWLPG